MGRNEDREMQVTTNKMVEVLGEIDQQLEQVRQCVEDSHLDSDVNDHYDCVTDLLDLADFIKKELSNE